VVQITGEGFRVEVGALQNTLESAPHLRLMLSRYAVIHGMQVAQTAACNRLHNVEQRLARWLLMTQDGVDSGSLPITHDFLATMLGTDRPTVSLAAGVLQRKKIIEYTRGAVKIVNRKKLEDSACECYGVIRQYDGKFGLKSRIAAERTMTAPDTNSVPEESAENSRPAGVVPAGTPATADKSSTAAKAKNHNIRVSSAVLDAAAKDGDALLQSLHTTPVGLTQAEAEARARTAGPNEVAQERRRGWFMRLLIILRNPLVILLAALSSISFATGDARAGTVMACMVVLSATLRFVQEARADAAAAKLKAMIHVTANVFRDGKRWRCRCAISSLGTSSICTPAT
jgi:hypothetical protein